MPRCMALLALVALPSLPGCGSCGSGDDDDKAEADAPKSSKRGKSDDDADASKKKKKTRPKACVRAEACCLEMADLRGQDPDLVCSGVKGVHTGDKCEEFHKSYAGVFEASGIELPEECLEDGAL